VEFAYIDESHDRLPVAYWQTTTKSLNCRDKTSPAVAINEYYQFIEFKLLKCYTYCQTTDVIININIQLQLSYVNNLICYVY